MGVFLSMASRRLERDGCTRRIAGRYDKNPKRVLFNQFIKFCRHALPAKTDSAQQVETPLFIG